VLVKCCSIAALTAKFFLVLRYFLLADFHTVLHILQCDTKQTAEHAEVMVLLFFFVVSDDMNSSDFL